MKGEMSVKKRKKQLLSIWMIIMLCLGIGNVKVNAQNGNIHIAGVDIGYAAGTYFSTTGKACTCHGRGTCGDVSSCTCKKWGGGIQCYGFAMWCESKLFGSNEGKNSSAFYSIGSISSGNMSANAVKNLIYNKAKPGAHIRTGGSAHSLIITDITESGFSIVQANGQNNKEYSSWTPCRIGTYTYTWQSYAQSTYGKRGIAYVKMPCNYPYSNVNNSVKPFHITIDAPKESTSTTTGITAEGWAIYGNGVTNVTCNINGNTYNCSRKSRPNVAERNPGYPTGNEGFSYYIPEYFPPGKLSDCLCLHIQAF